MRDVPIPERMRLLPRDRRGYPVPFIVMRDNDGKPHFTINDEDRRRFVLKNDRCPLCNHGLFRGRWYVGGPRCAFDPRGAYLDPPMHHECAEYALQVCPYLAAPNYSKRIDDKTLDPAKSDALIVASPEVENDRPDFFVAVMALGHTITPEGFMVPKRPFRRVEFWRRGKRLAVRRGDIVKGDMTQAARLRDFLVSGAT
jgi:hypothetical protein